MQAQNYCLSFAFEKIGTKELESPYVFNAPDVVKA
jgi:hypothetical protein